MTIARPWPLGRSSHPAGGIISNAREFIRYARAHFAATSAVKAMQTVQVQTTLAGDRRGLAWMIRPVGDIDVIGHGGATKGQQATFWMQPETGFAITVLTNSDRGSELHGEISTAHVDFATPDLAYITGGPAKGSTVEFLRGEDGAIAWVRAGGRVHARVAADA